MKVAVKTDTCEHMWNKADDKYLFGSPFFITWSATSPSTVKLSLCDLGISHSHPAFVCGHLCLWLWGGLSERKIGEWQEVKFKYGGLRGGPPWTVFFFFHSLYLHFLWLSKLESSCTVMALFLTHFTFIYLFTTDVSEKSLILLENARNIRKQ